ncbi:hypothetical protein AMK59_6510 [Oryctes borbonicus]|uniref:Uncharacterized protein n=1 Tax=Oryctes borbonicus TaxID=1629725 RepID=A0A0T6AVB7_9SCAR|nr:hypothetical protein AMK59_6510 [Oryctes borbonicus]
MPESSSDSDSYDQDKYGPTTRRAWSDWCSNKGKSSQSEEENMLKRQPKKLRRKIQRGGKAQSNPSAKTIGKTKRGRVRKAKPKKPLKINGLDLLHSQTLLSTSPQANGKKLPPPPGCVDQQLTALSTDTVHDELDIPPAPGSTPYALQIILNVYCAQYMNMINQMKTPEYKDSVENLITEEKERNQRLQNRAAQLEKQIKVLIDDSVALLKARMSELGINATSPVDLLAKAKEIVCRHKDLQAKASKLQVQVFGLEQEQKNLVSQRQQEITEKYAKQETGKEMSQLIPEECILREISSTLSHRKKLHSQVSLLEGEVMNLEKTSEERKQAQSLSAARQQQSLSKTSRKSRDYRTRSQDWPDIPDIAKIEEQNPEILAQKILEKGRMIEAGKLSANKTQQVNQPPPQQQQQPQPQQQPPPLQQQQQQRPQEPPRIANFEDRLKSIITSVLNEDQHNRNKTQMYSPPGTSQYNPTTQASTSSTYSNCQQFTYNQFVVKSDQPQPQPQPQNQKPKCKYTRCETIVKPTKDFRGYSQQQEGLGSMVECYRENECNRIPPPSARQILTEKPDYTQVSPAKLALRRHLSQEKLAAQQHHAYNHPESSMVATRTIGDLVSGEIERTLEISNQSIINAAVDMSDIQGTTTLTSRSVVNANIPPRPERVNVKVLTTPEVPVPNVSKDNEPIIRQVYSPISRPSSTEGLEGLAYVHNHPKNNSHAHNLHTYVAAPQVSPRTTILYPTQVRPGSINTTYGPSDQYTPLPRADIKPYHESYFHDIKPPVSLDSENKCNFVPEGLAASLQARVLNGPQIKEEVDMYERRVYVQNGVSLYHSEQNASHIKTENMSNDCQYKRESPVIQGPIRTAMRRTSVYVSDGHRHPNESNHSPEPHSNTSTPLVDEIQESCRQRKMHEEDVEVEEEAEESRWQDRISSGFDRLVAFASTELDKRRRSTEETIVVIRPQIQV